MSSFFSSSPLTFNQIILPGRGKRAFSTLFLVVSLVLVASVIIISGGQAAVTASAPTTNGIMGYKTAIRTDGVSIPATAITLTGSESETLTSIAVMINSVSGVSAGELTTLTLYSNGAGCTNSGATLTDNATFKLCGVTSGAVNIGSATTITADADGNPGNGNTAPAIGAGGSTWIIVWQGGSGGSALDDGDQFTVSLATNAITTSANSPTITAYTSDTFTRTTAAADAIAPVAGAGSPPDGQIGAPSEAIVDREFSEALVASRVNATNVTLQECTGADQSATTSAGAASTACGTKGSTLCSTLALQNNTRIVCLASAPLAINKWHEFNIGTGIIDASGNAITAAVYRFKTGSISSGLNTTPPRVLSSSPSAGMEWPASGDISISFPTGPEGNMKFNSGPGSVAIVGDLNFCQASNCAVSVKKIVSGAPATEVCTNSMACSFLWDATGRILTVNPTSNLEVASAGASAVEYDLCVRGTPNTLGVLNNGNQGISGDYCTRFRTSAVDATVPTVANISPLDAGTVGSLNNLYRLNFSEALAPGTVTLSNVRLFREAGGSQNRTYNAGVDTLLSSSAVSIEYRAQERAVVFGLKAELTAGQHCFEVLANGLRDTSGNAMSATVPGCFTVTDDADIAAPKLDYCDADNFKATCRFAEPVTPSAATTIGNYTLACGPDFSNLSSVNLAGKAITYNASPGVHEVTITGLGLPPSQSCRMTINTNITDLAGNAFSIVGDDEYEDFRIQDSATTGGFLGSGPPPGGDFFGGGTAATFWENPQRCEPVNRTANKATVINCEFQAPSGSTLAIGSKFVLAFPAGFTFSNADGNTRAVPSASSFKNADINGPGPAGAPTISASCDAIASTCTVTTATASISAGQRLEFELDRITTPATPVNDARITVVIKDADGLKVGQTLQPAPFDINAGGSLAISGTVCKGTSIGGACAGGDTGLAARVICDQRGGFVVGSANAAFMGHQETTAAANGTYSFTGLTAGEYECFVPPQPSIMEDVAGIAPFQRVSLSNANRTGIDFKFKNMGAGVAGAVTLTVNISGGPASEALDVFCNAGAFDFQFSAPIVKQITLNGSGVGSTTMRVQDGTTYDCGVGPSMIGKFTPGEPPPVPKFNFMPPKPQRVVATGTPTLTFVLQQTNRTITATVQDGSSNGIGNVFVHAEPVGCFDSTTGAIQDCHGAFAQTNSSGVAILNVSDGTYEVGADGPGLPPSTREIVNAAGGNATVSLKMVKSSTTISGQVLDESGNGIKYAHVNAERRTITSGTDACNFANSRPSGGWADSPTDDSGNYTLYTAAGTWCIRAFSPSYGEVGNATVTVASTSITGQNLQASSGNYGSITGVVCKGGTVVSNACSPTTSAVSGAFVNCFSSGTGGNGTQSGSGGAYSLKVKLPTSGTASYTCDSFAPGVGSLGRSTTTLGGGTSTATVNFALTNNPGTITVTATGLTAGFCDARIESGNSAGIGSGAPIQGGTATIKVPDGTYTVRCGSPKTGPLTLNPSTATILNANSVAIIATVPTTRTVAGRVTDSTNNLAGATLTFTERSTGRAFTTTTGNQSGSNNNLSATAVPEGTYTVTASKKGYEAGSATATVSGGNLTLASPVALTPTSGSGGDDIKIQVNADSAAYTGDAKVVATTTSGGTTKTVVGEINSNTGIATLELTNGTWNVTAIGDNGKQTTSASSITVTSGDFVSPESGSVDKTVSLATSISGYTAKNESETLSLSAGGLLKFEELAVSGTAPEINVPASALSSNDSSTGKMEMKTDPALAGIDPGADQNFVGTSGYDITPKDGNGNPITTSLTSDVTITIPYTDAQVSSAGVAEAKLQVASFNTSSQSWETFPTTVDTTNNLLIASVSHFSSFGVIGGVSTAQTLGSSSSDLNPPAIPSNISLTASGTRVTITWTDPGDADFYRVEVLRNDGNGTPVTGEVRAIVPKGDQRYVDTTVLAGKTYKYILKSRDTSLNQRLTDELSVVVPAAVTPSAGTTTTTTTTTTPPAATTTTTTAPPASTTTTTAPPSAVAAPVAILIHDPSQLDTLLSNLGATRKQSEEAKYKALVRSDALAFKVGMTEAQRDTLTNFVTYGISDKTKALGAGERRAVLRDYLETVGRASVAWADVERMTNGVKPVARNLAKEQAQVTAALKIFTKIYGHAPVFSVSEEDLAWNTLMYRIRFSRDLTKEKAGITEFRAVFGRTPRTTMDWAAVRVLGYVKM